MDHAADGSEVELKCDTLRHRGVFCPPWFSRDIACDLHGPTCGAEPLRRGAAAWPVADLAPLRGWGIGGDPSIFTGALTYKAAT